MCTYYVYVYVLVHVYGVCIRAHVYVLSTVHVVQMKCVHLYEYTCKCQYANTDYVHLSMSNALQLP